MMQLDSLIVSRADSRGCSGAAMLCKPTCVLEDLGPQGPEGVVILPRLVAVLLL